jgi:Asp-tRNA(Asn)/Glu-tRNA(Gln) amidotransferase A subunit family amidase
MVKTSDPLPPLHGLPVGIKDLDATAGLRTTWGSPLFRDHVPAQDVAMVANVRAAGGIILGKTNTPEWGAGANTRNAVYGATGNPFDPTRSAAGSSGGSAVALATGMVPLATGSDTGGSLRNPAAFCGIVGLRPSPGLVPNEMRLLGWGGLGVIGPMARTVPDLCLLFSAMASRDPGDPLAAEPDGQLYPPPPVDLRTVRAAFTPDFGFAPVEQHIADVFAEKTSLFRSLFAETADATPDCHGADESFAILRAVGMLASHLERVRKHPDKVGPNVTANVEEGLRYTAADVARAEALRTALHRRWQPFFAKWDVVITPSITISPRPWSELYPKEIDGNPTQSYFHWLALAYAVTLAGHPAISLPVGTDRSGMPFGLQVVGRKGGDARLLAIAAALEEALSGDPRTARPVPDIAALKAAPPISTMPNFLGFA